MKKEDFLSLVCIHLTELGASSEEAQRQRISINSYLENMGIGEDSPELEEEDPLEFAKEIFSLIKNVKPKKEKSIAQTAVSVSDQAVDSKEDKPIGTKEGDVPFVGDEDIKLFNADELADTEGMPGLEVKTDTPEAEDAEPECDEEASVKTFYEQADTGFFDALGDSLAAEKQDIYDAEVPIIEEGATREFSLSELAEALPEEEDYFDSEDHSKPAGNPVFFFIIAVILSPLWIALGAVSLALIGALYVFLLIFIVTYIPLLIALILGGAVASLAELIYSIIKFVTGNTAVGLLELGLGFLTCAVTLSLSVIIYRFGTKYAPGSIKNYWRNVKKLFKKCKRIIRKLREVCSI